MGRRADNDCGPCGTERRMVGRNVVPAPGLGSPVSSGGGFSVRTSFIHGGGSDGLSAPDAFPPAAESGAAPVAAVRDGNGGGGGANTAGTSGKGGEAEAGGGSHGAGASRKAASSTAA